MSLTFSINVGQIVQAERKQDIFSVLQELPDNTQKLISPSDVRDAVYSIWENSIIRETSLTGIVVVELLIEDANSPAELKIRKEKLQESLKLFDKNCTLQDAINHENRVVKGLVQWKVRDWLKSPTVVPVLLAKIAVVEAIKQFLTVSLCVVFADVFRMAWS